MSRRRVLLLAAGIAVLVVLVCLRPFGRGDDQTTTAPPPPAPPPAAVDPPGSGPPVSPDEHVHEHDAEGLVTGVESLAVAEVPEAVRAAERFAAVITGSEPDWADRAADLATPALAASLTEPAAAEPAGPGFVLLDAPQWARIGVPADQGTIVVDVTMVDGQWLASGLAWWPEGAS